MNLSKQDLYEASEAVQWLFGLAARNKQEAAEQRTVSLPLSDSDSSLYKSQTTGRKQTIPGFVLML